MKFDDQNFDEIRTQNAAPTGSRLPPIMSIINNTLSTYLPRDYVLAQVHDKRGRGPTTNANIGRFQGKFGAIGRNWSFFNPGEYCQDLELRGGNSISSLR